LSRRIGGFPVARAKSIFVFWLAEKPLYPFFPLPNSGKRGKIKLQSGFAISLKGVDQVVKILDEVLSL
jgi:hypothetical protein